MLVLQSKVVITSHESGFHGRNKFPENLSVRDGSGTIGVKIPETSGGLERVAETGSHKCPSRDRNAWLAPEKSVFKARISI
jgi:hypothetical protein